MRLATAGKINLRQGRRDRKANYTTVVERLIGEQADDGTWIPHFYVTEDCVHFWRTMPGLILDDIDPDKGPATRHQEDHLYDEVSFALGTYRKVTTKADRDFEEAWEMANEAVGSAASDPYAIKRRRTM